MIGPRPWVSGPRELLDHGLEHLGKESDFDRRMALICIDNAVELIIKTYLALPKRINSSRPSRRALDEAFQSFPSMLDLLEDVAGSRLGGIDLSDIDWYHTLRNQLYHGGNGLTVERQKVQVYAEIASRLYRNLFYGPEPSAEESTLVGRFLNAWEDLHEMIMAGLREFYHKPGAHGVGVEQIMVGRYGGEYEALREFRNNLVHGTVVQEPHDLKVMTEKIEAMASAAQKRREAQVEQESHNPADQADS